MELGFESAIHENMNARRGLRLGLLSIYNTMPRAHVPSYLARTASAPFLYDGMVPSVMLALQPQRPRWPRTRCKKPAAKTEIVNH